ncbi:MAG: transcription antitermination factor NusB [Gemmatimonadota bacterium]
MANLDRSRARGWALQALYAADLRGEDRPSAVLDDFLRSRRVGPSRRPYLRWLVETVEEHRDDLDERIRGALTNWRLERLSAIDRNVLRIGAAELEHAADVPPRVAIQEAIRLAERYGTSESARFVNGVMDALYRGAGDRDGPPPRENTA